MSSLSVRIPDELFKKLNELAKKTRRTKSSFIKQLIEENIEDLEYAYMALERMNDKKTKYLSTEEVEKQLEL
jgi:RHH-type rel operon transcriptional repressor/antitoxin RelB